MSRNVRLTVISMLLLVAAFSLYWVKLLFSDSVSFTSNSLGYYLVLRSTVVREFPLVATEGMPVFSYGCEDGNKPQSNGVWYRSLASPTEIHQLAQEFLLQNGFRRAECTRDTLDCDYESVDSTVNVRTMEAPDGTIWVAVTHYF